MTKLRTRTVCGTCGHHKSIHKYRGGEVHAPPKDCGVPGCPCQTYVQLGKGERRQTTRRKNPRPAKTYEYLYVLQGYYSHGWEDLTAEKKQGAGVDLPAMRRLRAEKKNYQQNEGGQYRIIERREKIA